MFNVKFEPLSTALRVLGQDVSAGVLSLLLGGAKKRKCMSNHLAANHKQRGVICLQRTDNQEARALSWFVRDGESPLSHLIPVWRLSVGSFLTQIDLHWKQVVLSGPLSVSSTWLEEKIRFSVSIPG